MLDVLIGRAQTGKSDAVLRRIAKSEGPSILLVPEHASHQAEVDLCEVCGPTASRRAEVLSFRRLCERVLAVTGGAAQATLDGGGKLLTLQKALLETAPMMTVYRRPSQKASFLQQLLALFDELRCYQVTPEILHDRAQSIEGPTHDKLTDLSLLYGAYESRLHWEGRDARDRMTKLCEHLEESRYGEGKDIYLDGFTYFNGQERRVLEILLRQARSVTVTLLGEADSRLEIFEPSLKTLERLRRLAERTGSAFRVEEFTARDESALGHLERYFFGENVPYAGDSASIRLRESEGVYDEVEQAASDIRRLVASGACRYRDITVAARNMEDYEGTIETVFARYQIPVYMSRRSDILEKPALTLILGVLESIVNGYEYEEMFRWLKTGLAGLTPEECDLLEDYVLTWKIHGRMWLRDTPWTGDPDGYGAPRDDARSRARLERIEEIRRRVRGMLLPLSEGMRAGETAGEKVDVLYSFLESLGLQEALEAQMRSQAEAGHLQDAEETAQIWEILCGILDQFVEILGDETIDLDEFTRLFRQVAAQYSVGTIPVSLDQVNVSGIERNDRHTSEHLFLLGTNDHVLPSPGQAGGILDREDREALRVQGVELAPTGMDQMGIELQNLYAALARPKSGLTVSYPIADVSGAELRPAFVAGRLRMLFPALRLERAESGRSYRLTAPIPALESAGRDMGGLLWRYLEQVEDLRDKLPAMERAAALRRGSLSPASVRALYGEKISMSASRLERLRSCHFAYFMEYGLRARLRAPAAFDAIEIGTFLHYLLENVARDVKARGGFAQVDREEIHALVRRYIDLYAEKEGLAERNARTRHLFSRLQRTACAVINQVTEELRCSDFVPVAFELTFGGKDGLPAVTVSEPDGELRVGGKVDRVDGWIRDGKMYLRVVDYKSGRKSFDLSAVRVGLDIQMLLYLFALEREGPARFGYEIEPAGVLYLPARDEILTAERNVSPEELERERARQLRRSGLLLADPAVLQAMEHEALRAPRYLPLRVGRDGSLSGSLASAAQLGKLGGYVETLLHQICREVRQGNIDADPWCRSEDESCCKYCDWASACHFQDGRDGDHLHYILPVTPEEFWREIEEGRDG